MKREVDCPFCLAKFMGMEWVAGSCPKCGKFYIWDIQVEGDFSDEWVFVVWEE